MTDLDIPPPRYKVGDQLRIYIGGPLIGTVTYVRKTHHVGGQHGYRIRVPMDAEPLWLEVRENEVEKV